MERQSQFTQPKKTSIHALRGRDIRGFLRYVFPLFGLQDLQCNYFK